MARIKQKEEQLPAIINEAAQELFERGAGTLRQAFRSELSTIKPWMHATHRERASSLL
jgi:hypothetical protein